MKITSKLSPGPMFSVSVSYDVSVPSRPRIGVASRPTTRIRIPASVIACSRKPRLAKRSATRSPALQVTSDECGWYWSSGCPAGAIRSPSASRTGLKGSIEPFGASVSG